MVESLTLTLPDADATGQLGSLLGRSLPAGTILLLQGNLGSGKTTLVQGLGQSLGIAEPIVSPTFTLISEYPEGRIPLYHLDLYRLDPIEVEALHLESYWEGLEFPLGIVAIEWAERLPNLPPEYLQIELVPTEQGGRLAHLSAVSRTISTEGKFRSGFSLEQLQPELQPFSPHQQDKY